MLHGLRHPKMCPAARVQHGQQRPVGTPTAPRALRRRMHAGRCRAGAPEPGGGSPERPDGPKQQRERPEQARPKTLEDIEAEEMADKMLEPAWNKLKRQLKKELPPDQASLVDSMKLSDVADGDALMRRVAEAQLGPLLQSVGSDEDPYSFFIDLVKTACFLQLGAAAALFYTCELGLHLDTGDSFRAVAGLGLGYFARIFIPIEQLVWPVYNDIIQLLSPDAVYDAGSVGPAERNRTLNTLGVTVAAAFLLPRYLLGWAVDDTLQIVLPMLAGLFLFDAAYLLALLWKLSFFDRDGGSGGGSSGGDS